MAYEEIIAETQGRVGIIRLNRPHRLNAWTATMSGEIVDQITAWNKDDGIGAVVLTGEGRAFCAGADVGNFAERVETNREGQGEQLQRGGYNMTSFLRDLQNEFQMNKMSADDYALGKRELQAELAGVLAEIDRLGERDDA